MQLPMADIPGDNLAIHPINEEDGYDLMSITSFCSIVPQVYHLKEPFRPQVLTFQGTVDGLAEVVKQVLIEEYRWLETVVETHQTESIIPSWFKYHSNKERNVPSVKAYHSLLPLIYATFHTIASQYHFMNIIMKTIKCLNPGQVAVDVCDLPVYALTKEAQYRNPEKFGPGKYFCLMGGLHIEMCILAIHGELIDGSGLYEILSKSNMSIIGTQNLWTGSHVKTIRYCIEVAASAIYLKLSEVHQGRHQIWNLSNGWKKCLKLVSSTTIGK